MYVDNIGLAIESNSFTGELSVVSHTLLIQLLFVRTGFNTLTHNQ